MVRHCTIIVNPKQLNDVFTILIEVLRDHGTNKLVKEAAIPTFGELLFFFVSQTESVKVRCVTISLLSKLQNS